MTQFGLEKKSRSLSFDPMKNTQFNILELAWQVYIFPTFGLLKFMDKQGRGRPPWHPLTFKHKLHSVYEHFSIFSKTYTLMTVTSHYYFHVFWCALQIHTFQ